ncbi:hypothetical protein L202_03866 [Cryptococcus amylolentus CBS 6039]|uniref:Uncharacterized protein n=1 Tax=Cryptococcus amylolentus CBS 6039 TaxID=1295533 RepID=A0A1E3HWL6_9TREE|nr:hypothetical protein L202_03866 [Cryptococcus amylolentus CBS 6039]ODN80001.1 hypothetical protein L202_03866 [Cryptococcus amylolentus CBS 6039]
MFKSFPKLPSLPQAIGLPFLSTQEDAQLKFKSSPNGIKRLYGEIPIPLSDVTYWSQYYTLFNSSADVYSLISVQDVRQALTANPHNLANLLLTLSHHLFTLIPDPSFPRPTQGYQATQQDLAKEALNCLRVLGRILVVVYEAEADGRDIRGRGVDLGETFAEKWLYSRQKMEKTQEETGEEQAEQFKLEDSDDEGEDEADVGDVDEGVRAFQATVGNPPKVEEEPGAKEEAIDDPLTKAAEQEEVEEDVEYLPSLIDRLFSCVIDLLFCAGFTLPPSVVGDDHTDKINYVIWEKGVGSTSEIGSTAELDRNKTEVLHFLLVLLSTTIYTSPNSLSTTPNIPLQTLTHSLERRLVLSLLCSFLNTSLTPSKSNALGLGVPNYLMGNAAEERRTLVRASLSVLLVALDYKVEGERNAMGEAKEENAFKYFVSKLHRKEDFAFILEGILRTLSEHNAITTTYLPNAKQPVPYILETYMLLWRLIDLNKRFRQHLLDSGKSLHIVCFILLACLEHKDDPAHQGLLRLLSYLLQTLSSEPAFAKSLNQTIPPSIPIPSKWSVHGTAADFLILSIYSIATTPGLNQLFPALTISVANVAPYVAGLGVQAAGRLMGLFKAFSAPNFLLADEGHPRLVYYLLETFNSVLYHKLTENPNLVYAILRSHQEFQTLATFTLMSGLRDIQRRKALRAAAAEKAAKKAPANTTLFSADDVDAQNQAEKSALLGDHGNGQELDEDDAQASLSALNRSLPGVDGDGQEAGGGAVSDPLQGPFVNNPPPPTSRAMSEKARGKMRATESTSSLTTINGTAAAGEGNEGERVVDEADEELLKVALAGVGPNGYVPTQEWVTSWQKGLPLDPVLVAISELLPKIQETQQPMVGSPSGKVFGILKGVELGDVLPPAPPIVPRRFQWSPASAIWLTSLLWGDIYVAGLTSSGIWRDTQVRLFGIKQAPVGKGRGAQVGRVLKMIGVV